jgi:hypothetical protein
MKKFSMLLTLAAFIIGGTIFNSCQKEETQQTPEKKVENMLKATEPCVATFAASNAEIVYTNDYFNVTVTAWNDLNNTYFTITRIGGNMTVRYASPGQELTQTTAGTILEGGTTVTTTVANPIGWGCGDPVTISYYVSGLGGGSNNTFQSGVITFNLHCLCVGCEDELITELECGEAGDANEFKVTFKAGEAGDYVIQGGLNAKVDGELVSFEADKGTFNQTHSSVSNSNANVIRWEGTLEECEEVTIVVTFTGKCETGTWTAKLLEE